MTLKRTSKVWPTSYVPAPRLPAWAVRELEVLGGYNPYGQPNYRLQWGMDARAYLNGDPQAIKYTNPNDVELGFACWMLERWASQEFFNLKNWEEYRFGEDTAGTGKVIDYLGPFPNRGDYILVAPLMTEDGEMLPISQQLMDEIKRRVTYGSQNKSTLGMLELQRRLKLARSKEKVGKELEDVREKYRQSKERVDALASRKYVGLKAPLLPAPNMAQIKQARKVLLST